MEKYTEEEFYQLELKKGEHVLVVNIAKGKKLEDSIYEVYSDEEWKDEIDTMFGDYPMVEQSVLNYLLLRMKELRRKTKVEVSYCVYGSDKDHGELFELGYKISLTGTYRNGLFKVNLYDGYFEYLDDDNYDGWE